MRELERIQLNHYHLLLLVKLPSNDYLESLNNFLRLEIDQNFEKYKIFDYRINNQLILK